MKTIYKYNIEPNITYEMPQGAQILSVQAQEDTVQLWALVDTARPPDIRKFRAYGTGHAIEHENLQFLGTCQLYGGNLVLHIFEETSCISEPKPTV